MTASFRRVGLAVGLFVAGVLLQLPGIGRPPQVYDEGLILAGAVRVLDGDVPYRDFWNTHPPGQIWLVAGLLRVFGPSVMVLRAYDVLLRSALALLLCGCAVRLTRSRLAFLVFPAAVLWLGRVCAFGYTIMPALLAGYLALVALADGLAAAACGRARRRPLVSGLLAGVAGLFRADFGLYVGATAVALIALAAAADRAAATAARVRRAARALFFFAAGVALVVLPALAVLTAQGVELARLASVLIVYPATVFPEVRSLPLPPLAFATLAYHLPLWICAAGVGVAVAGLLRAGRADAVRLTGVALAALPLVGIAHIRTRGDLIHQLPAVLPALPLAGWLCIRLWRRGRAGRTVGGPAAILLALALLSPPLGNLWRAARAPAAKSRSHGLPRARGVALPADLVEAVRSVQGQTAPGERLYVGTVRHDAIVLNDALFCFLAARRYATPYHNLLPGLATRADVQREIAGDLERDGVRCVVLARLRANARGREAARAGSRFLDDWIRRHYVLREKIGRYEIWGRP